MPHHVYKKIEVVGSSPDSLQEAIERGGAKAADSVHNIRWFELVETRDNVEDGKIANWQATLKIGFALD